MNERIKELAKQAGIKITPMIVDGIEYEYEDVDMDGSDDLEKFAKLIIQECAEIADDNYIHRGSRDCGLAIRQHFGVEE